MVGKIILTIRSAGRRHGPARTLRGPEGDRAARVTVPEPASRAGHRRGVPGRRSSSTPATRCRSSTRWCAGSAWTARRSPRPRRRSGTPGRRTTRQPPPWPNPGWTGWSRPGPGPAAATSSPTQILAWAEQQLAADPALQAAALAEPDRRAVRGARAPPLRRASAGPPPGALQKPLTRPPTTAGRRRTRPCPCDLHLAPRLLNQARHRRPGCRPGRCSRRRAGRPLRAAASCRPARPRQRVPARPRRAHRQGRHRLAACPGPPDQRRPAAQHRPAASPAGTAARLLPGR